MDSLQTAFPKPSDLIEVFFSYAHEDEALRDKLAKHLKLLERDRVIKAWSDRNITAGEDWKNAIDERLESANIILLLISADFLASDYCYDIELDRALERHKNKEARVIPVILRSSDWQSAAFGKLAALPTGGKAITSWENEDEAFTDVAKGLRKAIEQIYGVSVPGYKDSVFKSKKSKIKILLFWVGITFVGGLIILVSPLLRVLQEISQNVNIVASPSSSESDKIFAKSPSISTSKEEPAPPAKVSSPPASNHVIPGQGTTNSVTPTPNNSPPIPPRPSTATTTSPSVSVTVNPPSVSPKSTDGITTQATNNTFSITVPVYVEYDGNKNQKKNVENLVSVLKKSDFTSYPDDLSLHENSDKFRPLKRTEVRYYRDEDRKQAESIKVFLKSQGIDAIIPNKSTGNQNQIEIWLSPNAL
jgi:TIR domain